MRNRVLKQAVVFVGALMCAWTLHAQAPQASRQGGAAAPAARPSPPAPVHDMTGVWMMQTMLDLGKGDRFKQLAYQAIVDVEHARK